MLNWARESFEEFYFSIPDIQCIHYLYFHVEVYIIGHIASKFDAVCLSPLLNFSISFQYLGDRHIITGSCPQLGAQPDDRVWHTD